MQRCEDTVSVELRYINQIYNHYVVQFEVETTGVAHRVTVTVPPPQAGAAGQAVHARHALSPGGWLQTKQTLTYF